MGQTYKAKSSFLHKVQNPQNRDKLQIFNMRKKKREISSGQHSSQVSNHDLEELQAGSCDSRSRPRGQPSVYPGGAEADYLKPRLRIKHQDGKQRARRAPALPDSVGLGVDYFADNLMNSTDKAGIEMADLVEKGELLVCEDLTTAQPSKLEHTLDSHPLKEDPEKLQKLSIGTFLDPQLEVAPEVTLEEGRPAATTEEGVSPEASAPIPSNVAQHYNIHSDALLLVDEHAIVSPCSLTPLNQQMSSKVTLESKYKQTTQSNPGKRKPLLTSDAGPGKQPVAGHKPRSPDTQASPSRGTHSFTQELKIPVVNLIDDFKSTGRRKPLLYYQPD